LTSRRKKMKHLLMIGLMSIAATSALAASECPMCPKPTRLEQECSVGRFKHECITFACPLRSITFVRSEVGTIRLVILKTPCTGEVILYESKRIAL
jgi:hypothetical protein